jgi:arylsulfatase A-like enzyme
VPLEALTPEAIQRTIDRYDEELLDVDIHLGNIWKRLNALGLYDQAMLLVSADHGEEFYDHGGVVHGSLGLYNEVTSVPLAIKLPRRSTVTKVPVGSRIETIVQLVDLYPTIIEAMGLAAAPVTVGQSVFHVQRGYAISEWVLSKDRRRRAVTDGTYKLITGSQLAGDERRSDPPLLFHLPDDPGERTNLADERPEIVAAMETKMLEALRPVLSTGP